MVQEFRDAGLVLKKVGPLGSFANNAYVIGHTGGPEALVVDAPQESEKIFAALEGLRVERIIVTHRHGDHWAGIDTLRQQTGAPVYTHPDDVANHEVAGTVTDGEEIALGSLRVRVIHTPGHTPGSICLLVGGRLISGDTLFPGGPGRTMQPADLTREIESITSKLFTLPESTAVHPGHGDDTTIAAAKREYEVFASRQHSPDLCGDVTWLGS